MDCHYLHAVTACYYLRGHNVRGHNVRGKYLRSNAMHGHVCDVTFNFTYNIIGDFTILFNLVQ
jgi:hypothetical protein